jgi:hypothetical protein
MYTQLCFMTFKDGILRNGYISSKVNVDSIGRIEASIPSLGMPVQWIHDNDRKCIVYDQTDNHAYRLNAS